MFLFIDTMIFAGFTLETNDDIRKVSRYNLNGSHHKVEAKNTDAELINNAEQVTDNKITIK